MKNIIKLDLQDNSAIIKADYSWFILMVIE